MCFPQDHSMTRASVIRRQGPVEQSLVLWEEARQAKDGERLEAFTAGDQQKEGPSKRTSWVR